MITKAERTELRSVVRQQFKVLRDEVSQRHKELLAELEQEIANKYESEDQGWAAVAHKVHEAVMEANRAINDALYEAGYQVKGHTERLWIQEPPMSPPKQERQTLRYLAQTKINARVHDAVLKLKRDEADMLRNLALGALESEEARAFLTAIPTVGELVPTTRLAELEASLKSEDDE